MKDWRGRVIWKKGLGEIAEKRGQEEERGKGEERKEKGNRGQGGGRVMRRRKDRGGDFDRIG